MTPEERITVIKECITKGKKECHGRVVFAEPLTLPNEKIALSATLGYRETNVTDPEDRAIGYVNSILFRMDFLASERLNYSEKARLMVLNAAFNLEDELDLKYVVFQFPDRTIPGGIREESADSQNMCQKHGRDFDSFAYSRNMGFFDVVLESLRKAVFVVSAAPDRRTR
jgi:hypothetical protein